MLPTSSSTSCLPFVRAVYIDFSNSADGNSGVDTPCSGNRLMTTPQHRGNSVERSALTVATLTSFMGPFLISSVNVALPTIQAELGLTAVELSWIATSYLLAVAVGLVPAGKIGAEPLDSPDGRKTRVRAGPFPSREAAEKALDRMKRIGVNGVVAAKQ